MSLKSIGKELLTQDNRMTSHPVFRVLSKDKVVEVFFTNTSAEAYIEQNRHNLENPYIYIASGWRNREWIMMRECLMGLARE